MFVVVEFLDSEEREIELVPKNWIDVNKKTAYWPLIKNQNNLHKAVTKKVEPHPSWPIHPIKIIHEEENYEKARRKLKLAEETSSLTSDESEDEKHNRKERRRKIISSESEDEVTNNFEERIKKKMKTLPVPQLPLTPMPSSKGKENAQVTGKRTGEKLSSPISCSTPTTKEVCLQNELDCHWERINDFTGNSSQKTLEGISQNEIIGILKRILFVEEETRRRVKHNTALLNQILLGHNDASVEDSKELPDLPIKNVEDFVDISAIIKDDVILQKQMIKHLGCSGGNSVENTTRRILEKLLTHDVSLKVSWSGRTGKVPFKDLSWRKVINDAVRQNPLTQMATDKGIEDVIKNWFRFANDRKGGRAKRAARKLSDITNQPTVQQQPTNQPTVQQQPTNQPC